MEKLILTVATTGAVTGRHQTPYVPITPEEIADEVYRAYNAGAAIAHIHVRDDNGYPTMDFEKFKRTVELIRSKCDIILNLTSSGGPASDEDRIRPAIELEADLMSMDCGTMNFGENVFLNTPQFLRKLGKAAIEGGVKPEIEVFDTAMIYNAINLEKEGYLKKPMHFQFVLGVKGGLPANMKALQFLLDNMPEGSTWSAFGIGRYVFDIAAMAIINGGHCRAGMEDNIYLSKGVLAEHSAQFIEGLAKLAGMLGRPVASVAEARQILGLRQK
jgi:3-keto-5-aminohexanoate cleavage enzyme